MKFRRLHTLNFLLAAFMTMAAGVSCVEPYDDTQPDTSSKYQLSFQVAASGADLMTKADVSGTEAENKIYDLQVWAFPQKRDGIGDDEANKAVGYFKDIYSGGVTSANVTISFPNSVNRRLDNDASVGIDFYILANGLSVGISHATGWDDENLPTRSTLLELKFGDDNGAGFGTACVSAVPDKGLPMTAIHSIENIKTLIEKGKGSLSSSILLKRAVSKIRFVFAKASNMSAATEITSIEIVDRAATATKDGPMLPIYSYLFKEEEVSSDYVSLKWPRTDTDKLLASFSKTIDTPLRLRWDYFKGNITNYEEFLDEEDVKNSTEQMVLYLRESKKGNIKIKINYKIDDGESKSAYIAIPGGAELARNSWWTVYAYFMSYELEFQMTVSNKWDNLQVVNVPG